MPAGAWGAASMTFSSKAPGFAAGANPQWRPLDPYPHEH